MTDEKFTFIEDLREKKKTATGAHHRRSHCGKGGAVKFPSDYLSKKELKAMNGEVKSYRLNEPMSWNEFKAMPEDIQKTYLTALRERYHVSDTRIAKMMGTYQSNFQRYVLLHDMGAGNGNTNGRRYDKEGWAAFCMGVKAPVEEEAAAEEIAEETAPIVEVELIAPQENAAPESGSKEKAIPESGSMTFCGSADDALAAIGVLLGNANVRLHVSWEAAVEG